uniref:C3H1-type domain-containing protein n=1 Tax=Anopheles braziliensis TaxID=58242 RepID=A0A2M3ZJL7_9DIPT
MCSLVADYGDSAGSSESESSDDTTVKDDPAAPKDDEKSGPEALSGSGSNVKPLPSASAMLQSGNARVIPGSVFSNPFREAEEAKLASLEKHVKMVDPEANTAEQKRKVCWSYKKGRCRFGSKCNFAHDSDLILRKELTGGAAGGEADPEETAPGTDPELGAIAEVPPTPTKKKRPGLARELVPPRKVLRMYHREKYGMLK